MPENEVISWVKCVFGVISLTGVSKIEKIPLLFIFPCQYCLGCFHLFFIFLVNVIIAGRLGCG